MKLLQTTLFLLLFSISTFAQITNTTDSFFEMQQKSSNYNKNNKETIKGSPYLDDYFRLGNVYTDKDTIKSLLLRYNIFEDIIEYEKNSVVFSISKKATLNKITINNRTYILLSSQEEDDMNGFYEKLYTSDSLSILVKHKVAFEEKNIAQPYNPKPARYTKLSPKYYININGELKKFKLSKKYYKKYFPQDYKKTSKYVKENDLSFGDREDLPYIMKYIENN